MARRHFSCPHCGLALSIEDVQGTTHITYDPTEWRRLCRYPGLDSPALCVLEEGGGGGGSRSGRNRRPAH